MIILTVIKRKINLIDIVYGYWKFTKGKQEKELWVESAIDDLKIMTEFMTYLSIFTEY